MSFFRRRLLGAALLLLLILSGLAGPGGWYCADGSRCEPAFAAACCCGCPEGTRAPNDCCAGEAEARAASLASSSCGCYYDAEAVVAALALKGAAGSELPAAIPVPLADAAHRDLRLLHRLTRQRTTPPRPSLVSPGGTRAPPAA